MAIIIAGLVGLFENRSVENVAHEALRYDVELEDHGDDLRAAVLDVRHYHRDLYIQVLSGEEITRNDLANFENAYARLEKEINELDRLGVRDPDAPQPEDIRTMANEYHEGFRPAIELVETDRAAFEKASERGLKQINEMESAAAEIDKLGEELSADSLQDVDRAATTATLVMLAVIGGLLFAGAVLAYLAVRVVNELRRLYAEQQASAEKLAEASQAKTDFLADVSHELRTPLAILRGTGELGLEVQRDGVHVEFLEEMVAESVKMSRMVDDLLFLARSDSTSPPLKPEPVEVAPFLAEMARRAEVLARERGASFRAALTGEGELQADPTRIEQAVLILVDNAAKYGSRGGQITLASSVTRSGELRVMVENHGPGIPKEELPHIFERFYRVDKTRSRQLGGTGLGLPIAKTIVEAHGGWIEAASRSGEGTRMSLYFPLSDTSQPTGESRGRLALGNTP